MVVFDKNEEQIVATLKGHTKKVTSVIYHPSQVRVSVLEASASPRLQSSETEQLNVLETLGDITIS